MNRIKYANVISALTVVSALLFTQVGTVQADDLTVETGYPAEGIEVLFGLQSISDMRDPVSCRKLE